MTVEERLDVVIFVFMKELLSSCVALLNNFLLVAIVLHYSQS
jgi:hypothetical protein